MKIYKVKVYNIDQIYKIGDIKLVDEIIVKKTFFGLKEIVSEQPIIIFDDNMHSKIDNEYYIKHGYVLGVNQKDLNRENLVTDKINYTEEFKNSKFANFIKNNRKIFIDNVTIDEEKKNIKRK